MVAVISCKSIPVGNFLSYILLNEGDILPPDMIVIQANAMEVSGLEAVETELGTNIHAIAYFLRVFCCNVQYIWGG